MGNRCKTCRHENLEDINKMLIADIPWHIIAKTFGLSKQSLMRHRSAHIPLSLLKSKEARELANADNLIEELRTYQKRVRMLFDACDTWLRDPHNKEQYDLCPRENEVTIIYTELVGDEVVTKKALLSVLLRKIEKKSSRIIVDYEYKHADPRKLILQTALALNKQLELLAQLSGEIQKHININVEASPEWIKLRDVILQILDPYPQIKTEMVRAIERVCVHN